MLEFRILGPLEVVDDAFERLAEDAGRALRRGEAPQAAELLREALGLWRGEPLGGSTRTSAVRNPLVRPPGVELCADTG